MDIQSIGEKIGGDGIFTISAKKCHQKVTFFHLLFFLVLIPVL